MRTGPARSPGATGLQIMRGLSTHMLLKEAAPTYDLVIHQHKSAGRQRSATNLYFVASVLSETQPGMPSALSPLYPSFRCHARYASTVAVP